MLTRSPCQALFEFSFKSRLTPPHVRFPKARSHAAEGRSMENHPTRQPLFSANHTFLPAPTENPRPPTLPSQTFFALKASSPKKVPR